MERREENSLRQDAIDAANNNPFAQYEFGALVQQAGESNLHNGNGKQGLRQRDVTVLDPKKEWDRAKLTK